MVENIEKLRKLANKGKYKQALKLVRVFLKKNPQNPQYIYLSAVFYGDDEAGRSISEIRKRHRRATKILKSLLSKRKSFSKVFTHQLLNEYYWFSHQPKKQYELGVKVVNNGIKRGYYSQGVGATEIARKFLKKRNKSRAHLWARKAEKAWRSFFRQDSRWYSAYCWYAMALGFQGRGAEMEKALKKAAKISGQKITAEEFEKVRHLTTTIHF